MGGPGRRGHVPADRDRAGRPGVAAVRGPLADTGRHGRRGHPRADRGMGGSRLQPACPRPARGCPDDRGPPCGWRARDGRGPRAAAGNRSLHRPGRGRGRVRRVRGTAGCQRPPRPVPGPRGRPGRPGAPGGRGHSRVPGRAGSLARCRHGPRLLDMPAEGAPMRRLPAGLDVRLAGSGRDRRAEDRGPRLSRRRPAGSAAGWWRSSPAPPRARGSSCRTGWGVTAARPLPPRREDSRRTASSSCVGTRQGCGPDAARSRTARSTVV